MMAGVSRGLSDADMVNLAAFYSEQSCAPVKQARSTP
jgi:cytochrome c553